MQSGFKQMSFKSDLHPSEERHFFRIEKGDIEFAFKEQSSEVTGVKRYGGGDVRVGVNVFVRDNPPTAFLISFSPDEIMAFQPKTFSPLP